MGHKACHWIRLYIGRMMCTKFRLILLVTIASFFIATVSFAASKRAVIDCPTEQTVTITVLPDVDELFLKFQGCCCMFQSDQIKRWAKDVFVGDDRGQTYLFQKLRGSLG